MQGWETPPRQLAICLACNQQSLCHAPCVLSNTGNSQHKLFQLKNNSVAPQSVLKRLCSNHSCLQLLFWSLFTEQHKRYRGIPNLYPQKFRYFELNRRRVACYAVVCYPNLLVLELIMRGSSASCYVEPRRLKGFGVKSNTNYLMGIKRQWGNFKIIPQNRFFLMSW